MIHDSLFMILVATVFVATPALAFFHTDTGPSGLAPLQQGLQDEITGIGQQAALVGIGQEVFEQIDIRLFAMRIVRVGLGIVGITLIAMLLYGGALYMTSQGNEEKVTSATKVLSRAGIGTLIIIFSYSIAFFVTRNLQKAIYQQHLVQAQSCGTTGTSQQITCCDEWNAYQAAQGQIATLFGAWQPGDATEEERRERELNRAYDRWNECATRAREEACQTRVGRWVTAGC